MAPRFSKIMSKMRDEEDVPSDIPAFGREDMMMPEPERDIAKPFPPGIAAQEAFDDMLQRRVMDPLYNAGHEDLGAALSAIPSAAHSMIVPQTDLDVAATIIPMKGIGKIMKADRKAFPEISKAIRAEKKAKDVGEYETAIKALRGDDPDLGAIRTSPDIKVTPTMAKKNFEANRKGVETEEKMTMGVRPMSQNPRSTDVTGLRGGMFGRGNSDHELTMLLNLNKDIPGLEKLMKEREAIIGSPSGTTRYYRETPGLRRIETEIAAILKANKNDLNIPMGYEQHSKKVTQRSDLRDRIMDRDEFNSYDEYRDRIENAQNKNMDAEDLEAPKPRSWTDIRPENTYVLDGRIMSGKELKDELLEMSTGDFHTAKWELYDPRKHMSIDPTKAEKEKWSKILREDEELDAEKNQQAIDEALQTIQDRKNKPKLVDPPKSPKGDPVASSRFPGIQSQMDVAPSRMDERGRLFDNVGQSEFIPDSRPMPRFEEMPRRNYVERDLDPKEKMWNEYLDRNLYLKDKPEELKKLRNYFDNRWDQAQGTAEGKMMQFDMPVSESWKPRDQKSVTNNYIDELAFKKFAKPYEKTMYAERGLEKKLGFKPANTAVLDDLIQSHFDGDQVQTPGRQLQGKMYKGRPSFEAEQSKLFPKVSEAVKGENAVTKEYVITDNRGQQAKGSKKYKSKDEAEMARRKILKSEGYNDQMIDYGGGDYTIQSVDEWENF